MGVSSERVLGFARELQRASTFEELLVITRDEVEAATGYRNVWLYVSDTADMTEVRALSIAGDHPGRDAELEVPADLE